VILADSSLWIDHFRKPVPGLLERIESGEIVCHPFVVGELAAGSLHPHHRIILLLRSLRSLNQVSNTDFFDFLEVEELNGRGLGFVDIHLLASIAKTPPASLWTGDRRLREQAERLGLSFTPD